VATPPIVTENEATQPETALDAGTLRRALGQFPTGVTIVTAVHRTQRYGMTANSFSSVSLDPPLVQWSVAKSSPSHDAFIAADAFAVHFLGAGHRELALRFGSSNSGKFTGVSHTEGITGAPLLTDLAPIFECRTWARYPGGDHTILVGEIVRLITRAHDPLLFHSGELRAMPALPTQRPPAPVETGFVPNYLAYLLARASFVVSNEFHATLKDWNLSVPEWRVLSCLSDVDGLSVGELAAMALMKQPRLTKVLDRMEADDLIERRDTASDRRRTPIHLTAKGRTTVKPVVRAARAHEAALLKHFTEEERAVIKHALDLLIGGNTTKDRS